MAINNTNNNVVFENRKIKCLQLNLQRSRAATANIVELILKWKVDIAIIQEPYCAKYSVTGFPRQWRVFQTGSERKRAAVVVSNSNLDVLMYLPESTQDMVVVEINLGKGKIFSIISAYFCDRTDIEEDLRCLDICLNAIRNKNITDVLVGLDTNARSAAWFDSITNVRGKILEDFLAEKALFLLNENDDMPTFQTKRGKSNIDLTICSAAMVGKVLAWKNRNEESASDHRILSFTITYSNNRETHTRDNWGYRYKTKLANWTKFDEVLKKEALKLVKIKTEDDRNLDLLLRNSIVSSNDLNDVAERISGIITAACNAGVPRYNKSISNGPKSVPWWTKELTKMRKEVRKLRRSFQRTMHDVSLREYRKNQYYLLKKNYTEAINRAKIECWKEYCNVTNKTNPWNAVYKTAAGKLKQPVIFTTLKKEDGSYTSDMEDTLTTIMDKCVPKDLVEDEECHRVLKNEIEQYQTTECDRQFTEKEIKNVISDFRENKAPGHDGFTKSIVERFNLIFPKSYCALLNECLLRGCFPKIWKRSIIVLLVKPGKEDRIDVSKYRPISLLPIAGKILEKLLIGRLLHWFRLRGYLSRRQFGFMPQLGTVDELIEVKEYIEKKLSNKEQVLMISLDVSGAFDAAYWPAILGQMARKGCPQNLFSLSKSYFSERLATLKTDTFSISRWAEKGCPQGSCCGPGFWLIMYNTVLNIEYPANVYVCVFTLAISWW